LNPSFGLPNPKLTTPRCELLVKSWFVRLHTCWLLGHKSPAEKLNAFVVVLGRYLTLFSFIFPFASSNLCYGYMFFYFTALVALTLESVPLSLGRST